MKLSSGSEPNLIKKFWSFKILLNWTFACTFYSLVFNGLFHAMAGHFNIHDSRWLQWFILNVSCTPIAILTVGFVVFEKWNTIWARPLRAVTVEDKKAVVIVQIKILAALYILVCLLAVGVNVLFNIKSNWHIFIYTAVGFSMPGIAFYWFNYYLLAKNKLIAFTIKPEFENIVDKNEQEKINNLEEKNALPAIEKADIIESPNNAIPIINPQQEFIKFIEYDREVLQLLPDQIYAVQSQGNYVLVFWHNKGEKLEKTLLRINIGLIEDLLMPNPLFMRTHRSFIVNLQKVRHIEGNTRKLHLQIALLDYSILVARTKIDEFRRRMESVS
ncbi:MULTISPECIES: LytTR family transcriptional regulator DNA-binding domain-containing protein [unclassified Spirosoma]|uniref:LytR/AlgR family response regulator transcription factor n=1 Tax=unclassified Spirosoma TaxID=2621999 RepID=UPI0009608C3D|nr:MULTISPECIES: LytTR family transcriptional regulator DNA-binding domain-containing protein [unclassified Spirosoma]MBN8820504.1 LytTR family transcriptional regulator [Spirosoma sp.]OJW71292.1 MAG: hypothetical protein BGO59_03510 [Spirosoma sp. 48-14]